MFVAKILKASNTSHYHSFSRFLPASKSFFSSRKDFYQILGVSKHASSTEIKQSYYKLAQVYHPDKNHALDAKEKFAEINNAYETLSDETKRRVYDSSGLTGDQQDQATAGGYGSYGNYGYQGYHEEDVVGDFFKDFFAGRYSTRGQKRGNKNYGFESMDSDFDEFFRSEMNMKNSIKGSNVHVNVDLSFAESVKGVTKEINYEKKSVCQTCEGDKYVHGKKKSQKCPVCKGKGKVKLSRGFIKLEMACSECEGSGYDHKIQCHTCNGQGMTTKMYRERVEIPKGVANGEKVRIRGKGNVGNQGPKGDLLLNIKVKPDPYYKRDGFDVHTDAYINISQAVLGAKTTIETLYGQYDLNIAKGTQHGDSIRLPRMGVAKQIPLNQRGDHYVRIKIVIPKEVSEERAKIFEELDQLDTDEQIEGKTPREVLEAEGKEYQNKTQKDRTLNSNQEKRKKKKQKEKKNYRYSENEEFDEEDIYRYFQDQINQGKNPFCEVMLNKDVNPKELVLLLSGIKRRRKA